MISVYPYQSLGHEDHGWLNARHHFSFANYRDESRMGFGTLRVINDDIVKAGAGFDTHPHRDMEIITYVRKGAITHRDSMGNEGRTAAGDVQVMSAGSGVYHSEYNQESEDTNLYQIWITPNTKGVEPRWEAAEFPKNPVTDTLSLLVSGRPEDGDKGALFIYQDAAIYGGKLTSGTAITHSLKYQGYLLVSEGEVALGEQTLLAGDGAEIVDNSVTINALSDSEVVLIDVPPAEADIA